MLAEAAQIIHALFAGGEVTFRGSHFDASGATLWDLPDDPPPLGIAMSGPRSCALAGEHADVGIAVEPDAGLVSAFAREGGAGKPVVGQVPVCWDPDRDAAVARAHRQFRWFGGGWPVNANLPGATAFTDAVRAYADAGFTEVALVQIGGTTQHDFIDWARSRLLPALREI